MKGEDARRPRQEGGSKKTSPRERKQEEFLKGEMARGPLEA